MAKALLSRKPPIKNMGKPLPNVVILKLLERSIIYSTKIILRKVKIKRPNFYSK